MAWLALAALGSGSSQGAQEWSLLERVRGDVVVVTEFTDEGRKLPPFSPEQPVYFKGLSLGNKMGSIRGDEEPTVKDLNLFTTRLLRKQGFVGSPGPKHPPTQFFVLQWGYLEGRPLEALDFLGYDPNDDIGAPAIPGFLGPEVFRRGMRSREVETILEMVGEPIYVVSITSFTYESARTNKPVALWQTRISFPARGDYMASALPRMLATSAGLIGRETRGPSLIDSNTVKAGEITLGELQVIETDHGSLDSDK